MELRHLRYFVAVAEELSFTRAAQRLHIAQPPLSTQIRALEQELGAVLFERDRRRVHLTQAGRHFLERARAILASVKTAQAEARSAAAGEVGKLAIGFTASSVLSAALPGAVRHFRAQHPAVDLQLKEMTSLHQVDALHARSLDLGVLRRPNVALPQGLRIEEWRSEPLVAALPESHVLQRGRGIHLRELKDAPLIVYPRDSGIGLYWKVQELCSRAGFRPPVMHEAREASTMVGLVACGFGVAIVPRDTQCMQLEGVIYSPILDRDAVSSLYLGYREAQVRDDPHLAAMLRLLRAASASARRPRRAQPAA